MDSITVLFLICCLEETVNENVGIYTQNGIMYTELNPTYRVYRVQFQKLIRNSFLTLHGHNVTPSAAATVQVSYALPAVRFSCLLRGRWASFQDGVAAGKGFLYAPF
jgi:hypothetical protein